VNQKRGLTAIGLLMVFSIIVVGCTSSSGGAGDVPETVVFGAPLPLTGELSTEGEKQQQGYELWKETVNNAGGISIGDQQVEIDIQYYDYQSDTSTALQLAERTKRQFRGGLRRRLPILVRHLYAQLDPYQSPGADCR
jgi:hypothetical protein